MSGNSGGKKKASAKVDEDAVPAYLGGGMQSTFPQAMPGQLNALAEQLSMGYGAPVSQNLAFLEALYSPMSIPSKPSSVASPSKEDSKPSTVRAAMQRVSSGRQLSRGGNR